MPSTEHIVVRQESSGIPPPAKATVGDGFEKSLDGTQTTVKGRYIRNLNPQYSNLEAIAGFVDAASTRIKKEIKSGETDGFLDIGFGSSLSGPSNTGDFTFGQGALKLYVRPIGGQKLTYGIVTSALAALKLDPSAPVSTGLTFTFDIFEGAYGQVGQGVLTQCKSYASSNAECLGDFGYNLYNS